MINPLVSVCLITYKHENFIRQAIESVLIQKVNFPFELIIADDCSPDQTRAIIEEYQNQHPDVIKLIFQKKNVGGGRNFIDLINSANGKYIAYLEGDDYWTDPNKLQTQFDFMESNNHISLSYHRIMWLYTYKSNKNEHLNESNLGDPPITDMDQLLKKGWFIKSCSMFFINIKLPVGFEKLYIGDFPLHVLLANRGKIGFIDKCMGVYRVHENGFHYTELNTNNLDKQISNFKALILMCQFLNVKTDYKYYKKFEFDIITSFTHLIRLSLKVGLKTFFKNIYCFINEFGLFFTIAGLTKKIISYFQQKFIKRPNG